VLEAMHRMIRAFLPAMLEKGRGSIVNMSSAVSSIRGVPNRYVYGATKAAVIGLTKAVAADFIHQGIRANAICPGTIQSPSLDGRIDAQAQKTGKSQDDVRHAFVDRQPMARLGTAQEVAALALFLASTSRATSPARRIWWMAGWRCEGRAPAVARVERSETRGAGSLRRKVPDVASLHPGYAPGVLGRRGPLTSNRTTDLIASFAG
jgi:hypothetical protein